MNVYLQPDECDIYKFWSKWLESDIPVAILDRKMNATASNRLRYAIRNGYTAREISWLERNQFLNDIHAINTSIDVRQGARMRDNYLKYPERSNEADKKCPNHYATFIGCFKDGKMVAYIATNFCGRLAAASQILGHGDHLKNGCMLVVWREFVRLCDERGIKSVVYSRWKDGTDGLKYWKHSVGMTAAILKESKQG